MLEDLRARLPQGIADDALAAAIAEARAAAAAAPATEADRIGLTTLLTETLVWNAVHLQSPPPGAVAETASLAANVDPGALRLDVAVRSVEDPRVGSLPPAAAIRAVLNLIHALAPLAHISLWQRTDGRLRCLCCIGAGSPSRSVRDAASRSLGGAPNGPRYRLLHVHEVPGRGDALLIARPRRGAAAAARAFLQPAARALAPVLDRAAEAERAAPAAELLANASERRLTRIGFDLHDGPIQSLAAAIGDARLLDTQVAQLLAGDPRERLVRGRVGDLQARLVALEFELRCMSHSLESPAVPCRSFERVIDHEVVAFQRQTGIRPSVDLSGDFSRMSDSQRTALLRVAQEALRNIAEHSGARTVGIWIRATAAGVEAVVEDDGDGFDVDATLARAVRDGRLGLIGMMERVRLLGGRCDLRSRPGGPSLVSVVLPRWEVAAQPAA